MSLNARDTRELGLMEEAIAAEDPRFAANLSAFSRLAGDGAMPQRERLEPGRRHGLSRSRRTAGRVLPGPRGRRYRLAVTASILISLALAAMALAFGSAGPKPTCAQWRVLVCVRQPVPPAHRARPGRAPRLPAGTRAFP